MAWVMGGALASRGCRRLGSGRFAAVGPTARRRRRGTAGRCRSAAPGAGGGALPGATGPEIIARRQAGSSYVHGHTQATGRASPFRGWRGRLQLWLRHALPGERAEGRGGGLVLGVGVDGQLQPFERECAAICDDTVEVRQFVEGVLAP